MCNNTLHMDFSGQNACCLNPECNWHGPYLLRGSGWWPDHNEQAGQGHCPKCKRGKYISQEEILLLDPFFELVQKAVNDGIVHVR